MTLLANHFFRKGYNVSMILIREKEEVYEVDDNIELIRFHYTNKSKIRIALKRYIKLRQILRNKKYDAVVSFMYDINIFVLLSNIGMGQPIFVSERANPLDRDNIFDSSKLYRYIECQLYKKATGIILQTEKIRNAYPQFLQKKIMIIPNPINANDIIPYHEEKKDKIVAVGRLTEQKNYRLLIYAFEEFVKNYPNYILEIYGEGELRQQLETQIAEAKLENRVFLKGYVADVLNMIKDAKMYISSSNYEGISNSMLEAMALGIPCICTDCPVGGAAFVIDNGINGILIPMNNISALKKNMCRLAENEELRKKIGKSAEQVRERFSLESIAAEWEEVLIKRSN